MSNNSCKAYWRIAETDYKYYLQSAEPRGGNDISYVIKPNPIPAYKAYLDRPISERNASFGAVKFCEIELLEQYVFDDVLFVKVCVETNSVTETEMDS